MVSFGDFSVKQDVPANSSIVFSSLAHYDWLLVEPEGQASNYMMDLIAFLNNVFQAFTNLPVRGHATLICSCPVMESVSLKTGVHLSISFNHSCITAE